MKYLKLSAFLTMGEFSSILQDRENSSLGKCVFLKLHLKLFIGLLHFMHRKSRFIVTVVFFYPDVLMHFSRILCFAYVLCDS